MYLFIGSTLNAVNSQEYVLNIDKSIVYYTLDIELTCMYVYMHQTINISEEVIAMHYMGRGLLSMVLSKL